MKKNNMILVLIFILSVSTYSFAADKTADNASAVKDLSDKKMDKKAAKELSSSELQAGIIKMLEGNKELMNFVPGIKKEADKSGREFYSYQGIELKKLDKGKLTSLYAKLRQEFAKMRTERIISQLKNIENTQRLTAAATAGPVGVPVTPSIPKAAGQTPKIPSPPAAPKK